MRRHSRIDSSWCILGFNRHLANHRLLGVPLAHEAFVQRAAVLQLLNQAPINVRLLFGELLDFRHEFGSFFAQQFQLVLRLDHLGLDFVLFGHDLLKVGHLLLELLLEHLDPVEFLCELGDFVILGRDGCLLSSPTP
uniref:(northern house mosquito) hypothetical protein n=1 Tax=Culex pipiens TaxID=7175 RepID=A0A8D8D105_CULPI